MPTTTYDLDPVHSQLGFSVRHLMITQVHGVFTRWSGTFAIDPSDVSGSAATVEIDAGSVDTRNPQRDGHLASPDFFDVANHPSWRFVSREAAGTTSAFRLTGELTLRGVTRTVTFDVVSAGPARDSQGRGRLGFRATAHISRHDFGVTWNAVYDGGSVVVGDRVDLVLDLQLIPR
jgi:polyisoprenoid-binding protein YceI